MRENETGKDRVEGGKKIREKQFHSTVSTDIEDRFHIIT